MIRQIQGDHFLDTNNIWKCGANKDKIFAMILGPDLNNLLTLKAC